MKPRFKVIEEACRVEKRINAILARFLNIDLSKSQTLGDKSTAIPFNTKINLLMDCRIFTKDEKRTLELFSTIRNKFAHNYDIDSYSKCFERLNCTKELEKLLAQSVRTSDIEAHSKALFLLLLKHVNEVLELCELFLNASKKVNAYKVSAYDFLLHSLNLLNNSNPDLIFNKLGESGVINFQELLAEHDDFHSPYIDRFVEMKTRK